MTFGRINFGLFPFERDESILKAREIIAILATEFNIEPPEVRRGRRVRGDVYQGRTKTITVRVDFSIKNDVHIYGLLHEFAHHLDMMRQKLGAPIPLLFLGHRKTFCVAMADVLKAWGQKFTGVREYVRVAKRLQTEMSENCPMFTVGPTIDPFKYRIGDHVRTSAQIGGWPPGIVAKIVSVAKTRIRIRMPDGIVWRVTEPYIKKLD